MLKKSRKTIVVLAAAGAIAVGGASVAVATGATGDDDAGDTPITGSALAQAEEAALAETGGGTVTGTEVGDEESLYEVEVTLEDGSQVDVQLDEGFAVVGTEVESGEED